MRRIACAVNIIVLLALSAMQGAPEADDYPPNPARSWSLAAFVSPADAEGHFVLRIERHPRSLFSFTLRPGDIRLDVLDAKGQHGAMSAAIQAPAEDPLPQTVDKYGGRSVSVPVAVTPGQAPAGMYTLRTRIRPIAAKAETGKEVRAISAWPVDQRFYWLPPATAERTLRFLRSKYVGKRVFLYPGLAVEVSGHSDMQAAFSPAGLTEAVIKEVLLVDGPPAMTQIGATEEGSGYIRSRWFKVELTFKKSPEARFASFSISHTASTEPDLPSALSPPGARYFCRVSGLWDFERYFTLKHPFATRPAWPKSIRQAIRDGEILKGMTPDQVAWSAGWPAEYGALSEMRHWTDWRYDSAPPFSFWVTFSKGRVIKAEPDGTLP